MKIVYFINNEGVFINPVKSQKNVKLRFYRQTNTQGAGIGFLLQKQGK